MTISVELIGRLGNQLFQYAAMRSIALTHGYDIYYNTNFEWHQQKCLLKWFNLAPSSSFFIMNNVFQQRNDKSKPRYMGGGSSTYDDRIKNISDNTYLKGFFQNEEYFAEHSETIKKELTLVKPLDDECESHIQEIYNSYPEHKIVGIHLRRGDNLSQQIINWTNDDAFIKRCLDAIHKKESQLYLIFFTGGATLNVNELGTKRTNNWIENTHDDDIKRLSEYIQQYSYNKEISLGTLNNNVLYDYGLLSKCDYNVLPNESSFSWMASYINTKNDGNVYINVNDADPQKPAKKFVQSNIIYPFYYFNNKNLEINVSDNTVKLTPYTFSIDSGLWEQRSIHQFFSNIDDKRYNIVDIGAQSGLYSLFAKFLPNSTFYSFEPFSETINCLNENLKLNNIKNVKTFNIALSDKKGSSTLNLSKSHNGLHTMGGNPLRFNDIKSITINTDTLDNVFFDKAIPVDFIKIDTEGWEYYILKGGENTIKKYKPVIQLEWHTENMKQCNVTENDLLKLLKDYGYYEKSMVEVDKLFAPLVTA